MRYTNHQHCGSTWLIASDEDLSKTLANFKNDHFNASCTKVDKKHKDNFDVDKFKACLHPKDKKPDQGNEKVEVTVSQEDVTLALQLKDREYRKKEGDSEHHLIHYQVLYREISETKPLKVSCEPRDNDDSYEAKTCSCLKNSGFFNVIPVFITNQIFKCGGNNLLINKNMDYQDSCHEIALLEIHDYGEEEEVE